MAKAHFFDLDTLIHFEGQAWIVDKDNPNIPIMKISRSDFNLIESGIYRKQGNKMEFNGKTFWLPNQLMDKLRIKAKNYKANFGNLAISLQEFYNKSVIDEIKIKPNLYIISNLKNELDDIFVICSKQTKSNYQSVIEKLETELREIGLTIKNFYFINENLYLIDNDDVRFKKMRLLIQHLVGFKTDGLKFETTKLNRYDKVYFYDNELDALKISDEINNLFHMLLDGTDKGLKDIIREDVKKSKPNLFINKVNDNNFNKLETKKVILSIDTIIKTFERFNQSFLFLR